MYEITSKSKRIVNFIETYAEFEKDDITIALIERHDGRASLTVDRYNEDYLGRPQSIESKSFNVNYKNLDSVSYRSIGIEFVSFQRNTDAYLKNLEKWKLNMNVSATTDPVFEMIRKELSDHDFLELVNHITELGWVNKITKIGVLTTHRVNKFL